MIREDIDKAALSWKFKGQSSWDDWCNFALEMVRLHNEELQTLVPTNWLDPLLTGPDKVGEYTAAIEPLLRAVHQRLREAKP